MEGPGASPEMDTWTETWRTFGVFWVNLEGTALWSEHRAVVGNRF